MAYQFETLEKGKKFPVHETFMEAWEDMFQYVKAGMDSGGMSWRALETAIWINVSDNPMYFYDARDHAINTYGWEKPS